MNITEVRVKMVSDNSERLRAFCSVTLDGAFVIRDLKVIDGANGPFVAMPSRKLSDRCPKCSCKNHLRARYCNDCGSRLREYRAPRDAQGRIKLHADIAHPINSVCREEVQLAVIRAFEQEVEQSKQPGYEPPADEDFDSLQAPTDDGIEVDRDEGGSDYDQLVAELKQRVGSRKGGADGKRLDRGVQRREDSDASPKFETPFDQRMEPEESPAAESQSPAPPRTDEDFAAGIL